MIPIFRLAVRLKFELKPGSRCEHRRYLTTTSPPASLSEFPPELIRSFCIIAHIDHGKSTLSDRLLELTKTIPQVPTTDAVSQPGSGSAPPPRNRQVLDKLVVERERGITVKAVSVSMFHTPANAPQKRYLLNLIDTPGHVDFSTEVFRSLAAADAAILLVDATQGVQAQTLAVLSAARRHSLPVFPVLNKIDLPAAEPERVEDEIKRLLGGPEPVIRISAKTGEGVGEVVDRLIERVPKPKGCREKPLRAFVFDSWFDHFQGVVSLVKLADGTLKKGDKIQSYKTGKIFQVSDCGIMYPDQLSIPTGLYAGQCGWVTCSMKDPSQAILGDTFYDPTMNKEELVPVGRSIETRRSMVYASLYPVETSGLDRLSEAIDQLVLNDRSVAVQKESSVALGQGFRLGFLGTLHMDVFRQRLSDEYGSEVIVTRPFVPLKLTGGGQEKMISSPVDFPSSSAGRGKMTVLERIVEAEIVVPERYTGAVIELCASHRGSQTSLDYLPSTDSSMSQLVKLTYSIPLSEIVTTFHSSLNSLTAGYASFDYSAQEDDFRPAELVRLDIIVNGSPPIDAFAAVVHREQAQREARAVLGRLKGVMRRQVFEVVLQATIGSKVIASERLSAVRKDVTAGLYGGHYERKMKHLNKQKEGKKRLKTMSIGNVELPQEAFSAVLSVDGKAIAVKRNRK
ncbi:hypothetical protein CROQUDRAFT_659847 [Cronartium quercuum f. sp. fusiforme G11]|uniref:Tr-type G domain-containing protein n=1 Tax=Cronartium quercuum f. sp. fusiforme G11 TaxID=708437 RepID=A0A9P6NHZ5_9BASI|nr:hypothetical protein CROQUDRAFT_659847 [Cronartium quercuum f. sp. fusiforme G11]